MQETVQDFLKFLESEKGYAENTIAAYRNDLTQLVDYIEEEVAGRWADVDKEVVGGYIGFLKQQDYSSSTVARKVAAMKSFARFLIAKGVI